MAGPEPGYREAALARQPDGGWFGRALDNLPFATDDGAIVLDEAAKWEMLSTVPLSILKPTGNLPHIDHKTH